jgi:hypothetical protein
VTNATMIAKKSNAVPTYRISITAISIPTQDGGIVHLVL